MDIYWNHNTAFHEEIVADAKTRGGRVLDVGCGDGLLLQRLTPFARQVVGIDPDQDMLKRAQKRLSASSNVSLIADDFLTLPVPPEGEKFSTVISVATLHHMELEQALAKMSEVLAPGGRLIVVGLSANKNISDYVISAFLLLPIRIMDRLHGGMRGPGVRIAEAKESLSEIRQAANRVIPGAKVRRRFYYRYVLTWDKPET